MRLRIVPTLLIMSAWSWGSLVHQAWSAEAADKPLPQIAIVQLADGKELLAHWGLTPWAKVWADPAMQPLHKPYDEFQAAVAKELGGTLPELILGMRNGSLTVAGIKPAAEGATKPQIPVTVFASADFGSFAAKLFALAKKTSGTEKVGTEVKIAGADEALNDTKDVSTTLARFGTSLALALNAIPTKPIARAQPLTDDLHIHLNIATMMEVMLTAFRDRADAGETETIIQTKKQLTELNVTEATYRLNIVPEGFHEDFDAGAMKMIGYQPVDRALLARLPANVLMMAAIGYNGANSWKEQRGSMLASWAKLVDTDPTDPEATENAINAKLTEFGLGVTVQEIFTSLTGTSLMAITPSMPFPALSLVLPRSTVSDKLIALGLSKLGTKPPAEGASILIPIPNSPVPVTLLCDKTSWFVSSDAALSDQWLAGTPGNGWADSAAGKLALSKAPSDAFIIGSSDTPAVLRVIAGYAGMGLTMAKGVDHEQRQAILKGINVLATNAATGYVVAGSTKGRQHTEIRSLTGVVPGVFILGGVGAAVSFFNKPTPATVDINDEPEIVSDPNEPTYVLRERIQTAQEQFKGGVYRDQDGNGTGEYGLLSELTGRRSVGDNQRLALIEGPLARSATAGGYSYTIYLPGGATRVADDGKTETRPAVPAQAEAQEKAFIAYAWPSRAKDGTMYALINETVYEAPYLGLPPGWNAVLGGAGFDAKPTWKVAGKPPADKAAAPDTPSPATIP